LPFCETIAVMYENIHSASTGIAHRPAANSWSAGGLDCPATGYCPDLGPIMGMLASAREMHAEPLSLETRF
jgi:hypothetical protein